MFSSNDSVFRNMISSPWQASASNEWYTKHNWQGMTQPIVLSYINYERGEKGIKYGNQNAETLPWPYTNKLTKETHEQSRYRSFYHDYTMQRQWIRWSVINSNDIKTNISGKWGSNEEPQTMYDICQFYGTLALFRHVIGTASLAIGSPHSMIWLWKL